MPQNEPFGPDLTGVIADADAAGLAYVVIGGFSDGKILMAEDIAGVEHLRIASRNGIVDIMRGGLPPLDYETVAQRADSVDWNGQMIRVAALPSIVGFKRLASRPQDKVDLTELEAIHGELPIEEIPGLDS